MGPKYEKDTENVGNQPYINVCVSGGGNGVLNVGYSRNQYSRKVFKLFSGADERQLSI